MKRIFLGIGIVFAATSLCAPAFAQSDMRGGGADLKHRVMAMPDGKGRIALQANRMDGDWSPSVLHLQGDVRVEIWTTAKAPDHAMVLSADEVDYNEVTGDLIPRGNVKVVVRNVQ